MPKVATYVFTDLETTGLPTFDLNKTRITELSMVVVRRRHILDTRPGAAPRVQEKLTLCFNPGRLVHPGSSEVSGLDNFLLEYQSPFNMNVFNTITCFLQLFEKPVCLVAHNGHNFDFPILKNHFEKLGVSLPDDILCADSLNGFHDVFELVRGEDKASKASASVVDYKTNGVKLDESSSDQKEKIQTVAKIVEERTSSENQICNGVKADESSSGQKQKNQTFEKIEEGTSSDKQICNGATIHYEEYITEELLKDFMENDDLKFQLSMQQQNETTPVQKKGFSKPSNTRNGVRRRLFYQTKKPTSSYKLKDVYERTVGRPAIEAHRAENDCVMAMEASVAIAEEFVEWVDNEKNQCKFSEVNAMRLGVPLGD